MNYIEPWAFGTHLKQQKPTLILPCSDAKHDEMTSAFEMYRGKGYMGVVRTFDKDLLFEAFNVMFLSAKYGLIMAGTVIHPYDQKLTKARVAEFAKSRILQGRAKTLINAMNRSAACYVMIPKLYQQGLAALVGNLSEKFTQVQFADRLTDDEIEHLRKYRIGKDKEKNLEIALSCHRYEIDSGEKLEPEKFQKMFGHDAKRFAEVRRILDAANHK